MTITTSDRRAASNGRGTCTCDLIDDYVMKRIEFSSLQMAINLHLTDDRRDDIAQDMAVELLKAACRFDPDGTATWHTYACRVLDLAVKKLVQAECRMRERESGRPVAFAQASDGCPAAVNNPAYEGERDLALLELRLDIAVVLDRMPERLRQVCMLLMHLSPVESAAVLGIHRNSIYRLIARAREYFAEPGLGFCDSSAADSASVRM